MGQLTFWFTRKIPTVKWQLGSVRQSLTKARSSIPFRSTPPRLLLLQTRIQLPESWREKYHFRSANESDVTHHVLYWDSSLTTKLANNTTPIATIAKTGANLVPTIPSGTVKPVGATHFLVFTKNNNGEMASGVGVLIIDSGAP